MVVSQEFVVMIGIVMAVIYLVSAGVMGLRKKEIRANKTFFDVLLLPVGLLGQVFGLALFVRKKELEKGPVAISSSVAAIALGVLVLVAGATYYLDSYKVIEYDTVGKIIPPTLVAIIVILPIVIIFCKRAEKKQS